MMITFEEIIKSSYEQIVEYILKDRSLTPQPSPSSDVWKVLPDYVVQLLGCIQSNDLQIGDFIISRVGAIEREWKDVSSQPNKEEWVPITIGSTEAGEGISIPYSPIKHQCIDTIYIVSKRELELVAPSFDVFLRLNLTLEIIINEEMIDEENETLNSEGKQKMRSALEILHSNFFASTYWTSWLQ